MKHADTALLETFKTPEYKPHQGKSKNMQMSQLYADKNADQFRNGKKFLELKFSADKPKIDKSRKKVEGRGTRFAQSTQSIFIKKRIKLRTSYLQLPVCSHHEVEIGILVNGRTYTRVVVYKVIPSHLSVVKTEIQHHKLITEVN